jgi:hypothetical protein
MRKYSTTTSAANARKTPATIMTETMLAFVTDYLKK